MPRFLSASDETAGKDSLSDFTHGGFIADAREWVDVFLPQWQRMLDEHPRIDSLHMKDLRNQAWCEANRLTKKDADLKIDTAIGIMCGMQSVVRLCVTQDGADFKELISPLTKDPDFLGRIKRSDLDLIKIQTKTPDFNCLMGYWLYALKHAHGNRSHCERIDFHVEEKQGFTEHAKVIFDTHLAATCKDWFPEFVPLIGRFLAIPKRGTKPSESLPPQSADLLLWFYQRKAGGLIDQADAARLDRLRTIDGWDDRNDRGNTEDYAKRLRGIGTSPDSGDGIM